MRITEWVWTTSPLDTQEQHVAFGGESDRRSGGDDLGAELFGLAMCLRREVAAANTPREAEVVRIFEFVPAWPPTAAFSMVSVRNPSDDAYTEATRPAGPAPTTGTS